MTKTVEIAMKTGERYIHTEITETYSEGNFFCVYEEFVKKLYRYPISDIRKVIEENEAETTRHSSDVHET